MNYALVENGIVTNIIWLHPMNVEDFPSAVPMGDIPAGIGDAWDGTAFYRNGEKLLTIAEQQQQTLEKVQNEAADLATKVVDLTIENSMLATE